MSPEDVLLTTLATYLQPAFIAATGLTGANVVTEWPEPTAPLRLSQNSVVISLTRDGKSEEQDRVGSPILAAVNTLGNPNSTFIYEYGFVTQPIELSVWAASKALRDDCDGVMWPLLNVPFWQTVPLVVNTTLAVATAPKVLQLVVPTSMHGITEGQVLKIDSEVLTVQTITPNGFLATPQQTHAIGAPLVDVIANFDVVAKGLHLRIPATTAYGAYGNFLCAYAFEDGVRTFDASTTSQMQEWRSRRAGKGRVRLFQSVVAPSQITITSTPTFS